MQRRALKVLVLLAFALAFAACSDDGDRPLADVTTTTAERPAQATTTTSTTRPPGPASRPEAAATGLFNAWKRADRDDASRYAKPSAVNELFSHPNTGDVSYGDQGCEPQGGQFICSWTYPGGALQMTVEAWPGGGFVVDDVTWIAD